MHSVLSPASGICNWDSSVGDKGIVENTVNFKNLKIGILKYLRLIIPR